MLMEEVWCCREAIGNWQLAIGNWQLAKQQSASRVANRRKSCGCKNLNINIYGYQY
jgi:hypothetical protein